MASAEVFNSNSVNLTKQNQNPFSDNNSMDLNMDGLKMFESLDINGIGKTTNGNGPVGSSNSSGSSVNGMNGVGNDLMDGALEDSRSMSDDPDQDCKICK